jgi:hypothetical protein
VKSKKKRFARIPFRLSLDPADLIRLRDLYLKDAKELARERAAFEGGARIAGGEFSKGPLRPIFRWKSPRPKTLLECNSDTDVADALRLAVSAQSERSAMAVLCGLRGVEVPVASAILTAIDQLRFTVIDFRALETLEVDMPAPTVEQYLQYLAYCRARANEFGITLRDLDRALWQRSKSGKRRLTTPA